MKTRVFPRYNHVYKGNIHSHTTRSDGAYDLTTLIKAYQDQAYQFLCISDHHKYLTSAPNADNAFLLLDGMEGGVGYSTYHIQAIADYEVATPRRIQPETKYPIVKDQAPQETLDEYRDQGNICIINHPRWTKLEYEDLLNIERYVGIEIYNHGCSCESHTGYAVDYWDYLLRRGKRVFGFATDDAHARDLQAAVKEYFGGWICVSADHLTHREIVKSIKNGDFYASNGPQIYALEQQAEHFWIKTSPVVSIAFITYPEHGRKVYDREGGYITEASFAIPAKTAYLRIEITDTTGKTAWSNPLFF
jgi:predicted metal-dependent phosphoesterase TrpH